jgi:hypothetical protein
MFDPKPHLIQLPRRIKDRQTGHWTTRLDDYLEVRWRAYWFREGWPHGSITTEALSLDWDKDVAVYKATVGDGEGGTATGTGTETRARFEDFVEKAETRAVGRALALLGFGTQFVGEELSEGDHVADAPVASTNGHQTTANPPHTSPSHTVAADDPAPLPGSAGEGRMSTDEARQLKALAHTAFGYREGERRLRADLGFEPDEALTLRHLAAQVPPARYQALLAAYQAALRQAVESDVA